ncbi:N-acetylmuramoyl-L-alanine amidase [Flexithrix dorotheae]|uniref:N-acetylmuramoyl-L-alanine amidase n=1 Tax=Flexithrix dorotheae TaxID=70993 RepID=UPI000377ECDD|nr:N-acetylmuramoyl-L-alanine amidase [Flexithrix dorotheae]
MPGRFFILFFFTNLCIATFSFQENALAQNKKTIKVMIDPGHGGKDPGNEASKSSMKNEKHLNLEIAMKLGKYIEERIKDTKVIYTRTTDKFVGLDNIVDLANKNKVDVFISIHCNSNPNRAIYGTRTHIHSNSFASSKKLALLVENEFKTRAGRKSRGVMDARDRGYNLQVLQYTTMPGVLVECGFMSNPPEEKYLNSTHGQDLIASAIFRAFRQFVVEENDAEDRTTVYKVQIMASKKSVNLKQKQFQDLDIRVEEYKMPGSNYQYRYMVGREYDQNIALKLAKKIREQGFKDAFVVTITEEQGQYKTNKTSR